MWSKLAVVALPLLAQAVGAAPSGQQHPLATPPGHGSNEVIDLTKYTIGQILNYTLYHAHDDERRTPPLKKLAYVVNRTESIESYLSDPDVSVTLFAPDDLALKDIGHHHDHEHEHGADREEMVRNHPFKAFSDEHALKDRSDEPDDEDKREKIKKLITAILHYHISPSKLPVSELQDKQTIPTTLNQTKDTDVSFRIRVAPKFSFLPPPPSFEVNLNFYANLRRGPALLAKNGIIHLISAPLLPPITPLDQLLLFPNVFSTLTSAIQQTELDRGLAPYLHHYDDSSLSALAETSGDEPNSVVMSVLQELVEEAKMTLGLPTSDQYKDFPFTIFAPTNGAFAKIPFKIRLFLFSPFGRPYLRGLLKFHVVPQYVFHSDYQLNASRSDSSVSGYFAKTLMPEWIAEHFNAKSLGDYEETAMPHRPPMPRPHPAPSEPRHVEVSKYELPTLLGSRKNESLAVNVYKYRTAFGKGPLVRSIAVGHVGQEEKEYSQVVIGDGVAWGGAVHVVCSLIRPSFADHHRDHEHEHHGDAATYFSTLF